MAHKESKVDQQFIDTKFSSGDSNNMKSKQIYQEENNNVVNELVKGIADMGCIVDVAKCAPNVCIESCVYGGPEDDQTDAEKDDEEDAYSEDFDEDKSDDDDVLTMKTGPLNTADESNSSSLVENVSDDRDGPCTIVQMSKSHVTFMSSKMGAASGSGRSDFGSASVPGTRRVNMSFSNDRLREIQRHNHILLKKILCARNVQKSSIPPKETVMPKRAVPHATMQRKRQQRQIDHDNMILLRKIQRAKSTACSFRR